MQTVQQKFNATIGEEKVELVIQVADLEESDLPNIPRADIITALKQSHERGVRSAIARAVKIEGATAESVSAAVAKRAGTFNIYRPGARGRGASNAATQKDAANALKDLQKLTGRQISKEQYAEMIASFAKQLTS